MFKLPPQDYKPLMKGLCSEHELQNLLMSVKWPKPTLSCQIVWIHFPTNMACFSRIKLNPSFCENKVWKTSPTFELNVSCSLQNYGSLKKNKVNQACTHSFNSFAIHLVMLVSFSEVQASITFLAYKKIRKIYLHIKKRKEKILQHWQDNASYCTKK